MASMSDTSLKAILQAEKAAALGQGSSELARQRSDAMDYYLGDMSADMPHQDGRSKAVSTDVADTVEGLMPSLMEIFTSGEEVVAFEPVGQEDEEAAEQETDYVNHVFQQKNPGFLILHNFIKDALLQKLGVVKVYWDAVEQEEEETFLDQSEEAYAGLVAQWTAEGYAESAHTLNKDGTHDVTFKRVKTYGCAKAENVPPEEWGVSKNARCMKDADYAYHETFKTEADLIAQGYDEEQVKRLPTRGDVKGEEDEARNTVEENTVGSSDNSATRLITVTEHYIRLDYDGTGPKLWRITTGGDDGEVLRRDGEKDVVKLTRMPFAVMSPIIMPHRIFGRSVADLVMDIQRIKTYLTRALIDNAALANNPPVEIAESHATANSLDDLLTSRPGKVIRTKAPGGLMYHQIPTIGPHVFPMIEYFDATREWRTGVTRQGQGIDANALQNQSATAVNQAFTAAQARMKLIARIFAETGIRDLFSLLHETIRRNDTQHNTVRLRNKWVQVTPRAWKSREDMTISVGLGNGSKDMLIQHVRLMLGLQKELLSAGGMGLVKPANIYNSAKKLIELTGIAKTPEPYFTDPEATDEMGNPLNPPPEQPPDPKIMEAQAKLQIEAQKAEVTAQLDQQKAQTQAQIEQMKIQNEIDLKREQLIAEMQLKREQLGAELQLKREQMQAELQIKRELGYVNAETKVATSRVAMGGEPG